MGTEITKTNEAAGLDLVGDLASIIEMAKYLHTAKGLLPESLKTTGEIMAVILAGRERGLPPMHSLRALHVVKGKVGASAELMLSLAAKAGVRHEWITSDNKAAVIELVRDGYKPYRQSFTMEDAKTAQLGGGNWQKYAPAMLRARAISAAIRAYCPHVLSGVYSEDEIREIRGNGKSADNGARTLADLKKQAPSEEIVDAEIVHDYDENGEVAETVLFDEATATDELVAITDAQVLKGWALHYKAAMQAQPDALQKRMRKLYKETQARIEGAAQSATEAA